MSRGGSLWIARMAGAVAVLLALVSIKRSMTVKSDVLSEDASFAVASPTSEINLFRESKNAILTNASALSTRSETKESVTTPSPLSTRNETEALRDSLYGSVSHSTRKFSNFTNNLARGANLMTSVSGCHIAAWVYVESPDRKSPDCGGKRTSRQQTWLHRANGKRVLPKTLEAYDTVYVHKRMLATFVKRTLPQLTVPIVLLTGSYENSKPFRLSDKIKKELLTNQKIAHWFCQNVGETTGLTDLPSKLHPMALGVEPFGKNPKEDVNPAAVIRDTLLRYSQDGMPEKTIEVFEAYTSPYTNPNREHMPRGIKLPLPKYLEFIAKSRFVLSPDGHKPDCFRHYEALGFGAIPITELDPSPYQHLKEGPVVFRNSEWWNLTEARVLHLWNRTNIPTVNRNLIFEEYWMEDMEAVVGFPIRWFDIRKKRQTLLSNFSMFPDEIPLLIESAWEDYSTNSTAMLLNYVGERIFRQKKKSLELKRARLKEVKKHKG